MEHEDSKRLLVGRVNCDNTQSTQVSVAKRVEGSWAKLLCDRYKVNEVPRIHALLFATAARSVLNLPV